MSAFKFVPNERVFIGSVQKWGTVVNATSFPAMVRLGGQGPDDYSLFTITDLNNRRRMFAYAAELRSEAMRLEENAVDVERRADERFPALGSHSYPSEADRALARETLRRDQAASC